MAKAPSFKMSADTRFIVQELSKLKEGDQITYAELSTRAGIAITGSTPALQSAKRVLLRDQEMTFDPIRGVGVRRLTQAETLQSTSREIRSIRQKARKGARKLTTIQDYSALTPAQQLDYTVKAAVFTMTNEAASTHGQKKIEAVAQSVKQPELSLGQIAAGFVAAIKASSATTTKP